MNTTPENQEIDEFFAWLKPRLKMPKLTAVPPPPSDKLLQLVRESAKAYGGNNFKHRHYEEKLILLAADDGSARSGAIRIESKNKEWAIIREILPDDPDWQVFKFKCKDEFIDKYKGARVEVDINGQIFDLGEVSRRGIAEAEVPSGLDLNQADVRIDNVQE